MTSKRVLVTVGTTKFEKLIETVTTDEILNVLQQLGYTSIILQTGSGKYTEKKPTTTNINLTYQPYIDDFCAAIKNSDLVISHAGAGTCLEVLQNEKPLIVVVNEDLMDNHQYELAEELQERNYLFYCTCETLSVVLREKNFEDLIKYPKANTKIFADYLDKCMGFV